MEKRDKAIPKKGSWFSHISLEVPGENTGNEWLEPVSDEGCGNLQGRRCFSPMRLDGTESTLLNTERLVLRPFRMDDLDLIRQIYCDERVLKYSPFDTMSESQAERHLEKIIRNWGQPPEFNHEMAVVVKETELRIGRAHIEVDPKTDTGMIGCFLTPEHWGYGYATEIIHALIDCCFDELHLHRVNALCHPENRASWHMMEKCGMRREAHLRQKCRYVKGGMTRWEDELEYAILASERKADSTTPVCAGLS